MAAARPWQQFGEAVHSFAEAAKANKEAIHCTLARLRAMTADLPPPPHPPFPDQCAPERAASVLMQAEHDQERAASDPHLKRPRQEEDGEAAAGAGSIASATHLAVGARESAALQVNMPVEVPVQERTTCSICLDAIIPKTTATVEAPCGHRFHFNCLMPWTNLHNTCPLCREQVLTGVEVDSSDEEDDDDEDDDDDDGDDEDSDEDGAGNEGVGAQQENRGAGAAADSDSDGSSEDGAEDQAAADDNPYGDYDLSDVDLDDELEEIERAVLASELQL